MFRYKCKSHYQDLKQPPKTVKVFFQTLAIQHKWEHLKNEKRILKKFGQFWPFWSFFENLKKFTK